MKCSKKQGKGSRICLLWKKKKKQRAPGKIGRMEKRRLGVKEGALSSDIHQKLSVRPSKPPVTHLKTFLKDLSVLSGLKRQKCIEHKHTQIKEKLGRNSNANYQISSFDNTCP